MKVLSLNTWAGKQFNELTKYISKNSKAVDVFCFQEVMHTESGKTIVEQYYRANLFSELQNCLKHHTGYFAPALDGIGFSEKVDFPLQWGVAMFLKNDLDIKQIGDVFIVGNYERNHEPGRRTPRNLQYAVLGMGNEEVTVAHLHGLWNGKGKTDSDERIGQSREIKRFTDSQNGKLVLLGDFNLLPETQSLSMLEERLVNLIKTNNIQSTRSKLYLKPERFADYTFVSPDVRVNSFEVPEVDVSDHLPMILDFS